MSLALSLVFGSLVGLSLGLFGSGGSVLAVPILVYGLGYSPKSAVAMSLAIVGLSALSGVIRQWRRRSLCPKAALFFSASGIIGTLGGTWLAMKVSGSFQLILFALLMITTSITMFFKKEADVELGRDECQMNSGLAGTLGVGVGFLTGLLGVGGGFLIVPALNSLGKLKLRLAMGTSLIVISVNSAVGFLGYLTQVEFDWKTLLSFSLSASLASLLGVSLSHRLHVEKLRKFFAGFIFILGIWVFIKQVYLT